jgi:hypothetical protein
VRYFTGFDLSKTGLKRFSQDEVANPTVEGRIVWTAPQSAFSKDAQDQLAAMPDGAWETTFAALVTRLQADTYMEPVLKLQLLGRVLEIGGEGSSAFRHAYAKHAEVLAGAGIDSTVNWIDPDDADGQNARVAAEGVVRRLPDAASAAKAVAAVVAGLKQPDLGGPYRWIGWLRRDRERNWTVAAPVRPSDSVTAELFVLSVPASNAPGELVPIGRMSNGGFELQLIDSAVLIEGRPVYAVTVRELEKTSAPP